LKIYAPVGGVISKEDNASFVRDCPHHIESVDDRRFVSLLLDRASLFPLTDDLGIDFCGMFHLNPGTGLRKHIRELEHAGWAAGGYHCGPRPFDVFPLAAPDGPRNLIMLQVKTAAAAAAPIRLRHLLQIISGVGLD